MTKKLSFEQALTRLQEITLTLEKSDESLENSLKLFEEGAKLSTFCYESLNKAEQKITDISTKLTEGDKENG